MKTEVHTKLKWTTFYHSKSWFKERDAESKHFVTLHINYGRSFQTWRQLVSQSNSGGLFDCYGEISME